MKIITLALLGCISLSARSQQNTKKDFVPPTLIRTIGVSFQKFDGLNSRIANRPEYKQLRDYAGTIEIGSMRVYKRFVSDIILTAGSSMSGDRNRRSSTIRYLGAGIDFGYDVIPSEKIILYPMAGIGVQGYMARFYKDNSQVPFDLVLVSSGVQNDVRPVDFKNSFVTYRLGLGFSMKSAKHPTSTMGIRASYNGSFKDRAWKSSDNQDLAGAPKDGLSQFNISLVLTGMPMMHK